MNSTEWYKIKEEIYYQDGSWRDIYVQETTQEDWNNWIDLVNRNYSVQFYNGPAQQTEFVIDKKAVFDYQDRKTDLASSAVIKLQQITLNCRFFSVQQIENDVDPKEIATIDDHNNLLSYLTDISKGINKKVVLTAENEPETVYISVEGDNVELNTK